MLQRYADRLDFLGCTVREVGEGAIFDLAPLAVRLAQEDTTIYRTIGARASRLREIHSDDDGKQSFTALQEGHTKSSDYIPLPMNASKPQSYSILPVVRRGEHGPQSRRGRGGILSDAGRVPDGPGAGGVEPYPRPHLSR